MSHLERIRRDAGFARQEDLARAAGVPQQAVSRLERGGTARRTEYAERVAKALNMTWEDLFGQENSWVADPLGRAMLTNTTFEHDHTNSSRRAEGVLN